MQSTTMSSHITTPLSVLEQGFRLVTRDHFLQGVIEIAAFTGATSITPAEIEEAHADIAAEMRGRVLQYPGQYVIYDPHDDGEGWMLVGDDPHALLFQTAQMLEEML